MKTVTLVTWVHCPYCDFHQPIRPEYEVFEKDNYMHNRAKLLVTCDKGEGGCDQLFAVTTTIETVATVYALNEAEAVQ